MVVVFQPYDVTTRGPRYRGVTSNAQLLPRYASVHNNKHGLYRDTTCTTVLPDTLHLCSYDLRLHSVKLKAVNHSPWQK